MLLFISRDWIEVMSLLDQIEINKVTRWKVWLLLSTPWSDDSFFFQKYVTKSPTYNFHRSDFRNSENLKECISLIETIPVT